MMRFHEKGDSRQIARAGWLVALPLLGIGCAHGGVTISAAQRSELVALAHDAERLCQARGNLSPENFPLMNETDGACVHLAQRVEATCGVAK